MPILATPIWSSHRCALVSSEYLCTSVNSRVLPDVLERFQALESHHMTITWQRVPSRSLASGVFFPYEHHFTLRNSSFSAFSPSHSAFFPLLTFFIFSHFSPYHYYLFCRQRKGQDQISEFSGFFNKLIFKDYIRLLLGIHYMNFPIIYLYISVFSWYLFSSIWKISTASYTCFIYVSFSISI